MQDPFDGLTAFLAVAQHRSFTAAGASLGVSPAAVSQAIRALEARVGVALFQRTTRRVAPTEAGAALHARLRPAAAEIHEAMEALGAYRDRPMGLLRLTSPRMAVPLILEGLLPAFRRAYPEVAVEVSVDDSNIDLVAEGFDAGIRIGEAIEKDMVAVRLTRDIAWSVVGSPAYFERMGRPATPEALTGHQAIRFRFLTSGGIYRWEFEREGREFSVDVGGGVTVNDAALMIALARDGAGLAYVADLHAEADLAAGRLERVLTAYLPTSPGLFLYFPARAQTQPKLRAFIDMAAARRA